MSDKMEWREVPGFPNYLTGRYGTGKAVVKSKKRPKSEMLGIKSNAYVGGNVLKENNKGKVSIRDNGRIGRTVVETPENIYKSAFEGAPLGAKQYKKYWERK